jgi:hypothetical protein
VFLRLGLHVGFCFLFKVNRNRPVMSKQHPSILSPFFPGHSRNVRTGQRDSAGNGPGNELIKNPFNLLISMPHHLPYGILHAVCNDIPRMYKADDSNMTRKLFPFDIAQKKALFCILSSLCCNGQEVGFQGLSSSRVPDRVRRYI